jgi:hypothetical protein
MRFFKSMYNSSEWRRADVARDGFTVVAKLWSQTLSRTVAYSSSLRCHDQTALVSSMIHSGSCLKLASRNTDRCDDPWSWIEKLIENQSVFVKTRETGLDQFHRF